MAKKKSGSWDPTSAPELGDKTLLYLFGFAFMIACLANSYLLMQMSQNFKTLHTGILNIKVSVPVDVPAQQEPQVSPLELALPLLSADARALIQKYQVGGTPTLVLNCNKVRVGTYAVAESGGGVPAGSEMSTLISSLCQIAGSESVFCKDVNQTILDSVQAKLAEQGQTGIQVSSTSDSPCGSAETVIIYSFSSPSCSFCSAQEPILKALKEKYQDAVQITTICTPIQGADDVAQCKASAGTYGMI